MSKPTHPRPQSMEGLEAIELMKKWGIPQHIITTMFDDSASTRPSLDTAEGLRRAEKLYELGFSQHRISIAFGVNQARVNEALRGFDGYKYKDTLSLFGRNKR